MDIGVQVDRIAHELAQQLLEFLNVTEEETSTAHEFVVYSGEFQPFHSGNYLVYKALVQFFGDDKTFIATNDTENGPLSFDAKVKTMSDMFKINPDKIVQVKYPLIPKEVLQKFNPSTDTYVLAVSPQDAVELKNAKYYQPFVPAGSHVSFGKHGYYVTTPPMRETPSGAGTAQQLMQIIQQDGVDGAVKNHAFRKLFGKQDDDAFGNFLKALDGDDGKPKQTHADEPVGGGLKQTDDDGKHPRGKKIDAGKSKKVPVMQQYIKNPDTGRMIKVQSGLKYPREKSVYKIAVGMLKRAGIDRADRQATDDLHITKLYQSFKDKKKTSEK